MGISISGQTGAILRQEVDNGVSFTCERTSHVAGVANPTNERSYIFKYDRNSSDGEGLFEFSPLVPRLAGTEPIIFVSWVKLIVGAAVTWNIYITDGDNAGGATVDTPGLDVELASGTGSTEVRIMRDFPPQCKLRVTTAAVTSPFGAIEVEFHPVEELTRPWN